MVAVVGVCGRGSNRSSSTTAVRGRGRGSGSGSSSSSSSGSVVKKTVVAVLVMYDPAQNPKTESQEARALPLTG